MIQVFLGAKGQQHGHKICTWTINMNLTIGLTRDTSHSQWWYVELMAYLFSTVWLTVSASSEIVSEVDETPAG